MSARQAFRPRTGFRAVQAQRRPDRLWRNGAHGYPAAWTPHGWWLEGKEILRRRSGWRREPVPAMHRQHPAENHEAEAERQALHGEQHHGDEINLIHMGNLIRRPASSNYFHRPRQRLGQGRAQTAPGAKARQGFTSVSSRSARDTLRRSSPSARRDTFGCRRATAAPEIPACRRDVGRG